MAKQEKLEELKRLFHITVTLEKEYQKERPRDIYAKGFVDGQKSAYIDAIQLLMNKAEKENMYEWLWDI